MRCSLIALLLREAIAFAGPGLRPRGSRVRTQGLCDMRASSKAALPKAVVFDLDGCLWYPDMYMLWGGGAPFKEAKDGALLDARGQRVTMLGAVPQVLHELKTDPRWKGTVVAVASCTDEPDWAQECMRKFRVDGGLSIKDVVTVEEIHKGNKQGHLRNIAESTGIALEEMIFFDNEYGNVQSVNAIGVTCAYVPDGVTQDAWDKAISGFPSPGEIIAAQSW